MTSYEAGIFLPADQAVVFPSARRRHPGGRVIAGKVAVILQARTGSQRLPGKVLASTCCRHPPGALRLAPSSVRRRARDRRHDDLASRRRDRG